MVFTSHAEESKKVSSFTCIDCSPGLDLELCVRGVNIARNYTVEITLSDKRIFIINLIKHGFLKSVLGQSRTSHQSGSTIVRPRNKVDILAVPLKVFSIDLTAGEKRAE